MKDKNFADKLKEFISGTRDTAAQLEQWYNLTGITSVATVVLLLLLLISSLRK